MCRGFGSEILVNQRSQRNCLPDLGGKTKSGDLEKLSREERDLLLRIKGTLGVFGLEFFL